jgi:hypothetical protein
MDRVKLISDKNNSRCVNQTQHYIESIIDNPIILDNEKMVLAYYYDNLTNDNANQTFAKISEWFEVRNKKLSSKERKNLKIDIKVRKYACLFSVVLCMISLFLRSNDFFLSEYVFAFCIVSPFVSLIILIMSICEIKHVQYVLDEDNILSHQCLQI